MSYTELQKKVNEYFVNEYLPAKNHAENVTTQEATKEGSAALHHHTKVIIHYQERICSQIFAGIQNGKTKTMQVSPGFRACLPCEYLSPPGAFGVLPFKQFETYHDVRSEWASISDEKKEIMLEVRKF
jgi:hypothetical protein